MKESKVFVNKGYILGVKEMEYSIEEVFNLPDLKFVQFCEWKFQLNRGIYNNIDNWFYEKGVQNIVDRRKHIIKFLFFVCVNGQKIRFGSGGLKNRLEEFWNQLSVQVSDVREYAY